MSAILYRHWLEIRGTVVLCGVVTLIVSAILVIRIAVMDANDVLPANDTLIAFHAWLTGVLGLFAALTLGGTGVRTSWVAPGHCSRSYTLTLPVSRSAWVLTRFAAGLVAGCGLILAMLMIVVTAAMAFGSVIPIGRLAISSLLVALGMIAVQTAVNMLQTWDEGVGALAVTAVFVVFVLSASSALNNNRIWPWALTPVRGLIGSPPTALALTGLIVLAATLLATVAARRRDF